MPLTDLPLEELRSHRPSVREPEDFDAFWADTIAQARAAAEQTGAHPVTVPADTPVTGLVIEDLTFPGFAADPVRAWVTRPAGASSGPDDARLPVVVEFLGYNGGRGRPGERVAWALAGYVHVVMDTRGQGSGWGGGDTPDPHGAGPHIGGWMTSGIDRPEDHHYRRVYTDAVRLVDAVRTLPGVDPDRIALTGGSQGGGIAIAAAALVQAHVGPIVAVLPDVAFLCDWEHGALVAVSDPYQELVRYLAVHRDAAETVWTTASYLDGVNFAARIDAPALFSVALMDEVVPPRTTFAAYNALASTDRQIEVYPYNGHEGGGFRHWERQVAFLRERDGRR
ncbi:acetyl xylan esterase [Curtobacterium sp. Leaf183]|uniref:acetylxylan esterase n=1 Tax=Curtobacterium sp. Leaf183 TaxID=1736291 RepID=UPI0006FE02C1|nr:acetylxylan esterase [Curtobacterium sp. Leaf183]KQS08956.1 acetyl xylan esterase [Curtobacterium sp. Leaf183]